MWKFIINKKYIIKYINIKFIFDFILSIPRTVHTKDVIMKIDVQTFECHVIKSATCFFDEVRVHHISMEKEFWASEYSGMREHYVFARRKTNFHHESCPDRDMTGYNFACVFTCFVHTYKTYKFGVF